MDEIILSVMSPGPEFQPYLLKALQLFEQEHKARVNLQSLSWRSGRSQLINFALFRSGPDVSEIGSTWLSNFATIEAIRLFSDQVIERLGGREVFLPVTWSGCMMHNHLWAVPWTVDVRSVYYRRDLLAKAGVEADQAFHLDRLSATLQALRDSGVAQTWFNGVHGSSLITRLAPWVWAKGGEFISEDGRTPLFLQPEALAGIYDYFHMQLPFLTPNVYEIASMDGNALFHAGEIAAIVSGYWTMRTALLGFSTPQVVDNLGVAPPPGFPYVGGSSLVIWKHSQRAELALKLIEFLTSVRVQSEFVQTAGLLSPRVTILESEQFKTDANLRVLRYCLENGRSLPANFLWGLIEDKLNFVIRTIWRSLFANPTLDLQKVIEQRFESLARQIEQNLAE